MDEARAPKGRPLPRRSESDSSGETELESWRGDAQRPHPGPASPAGLFPVPGAPLIVLQTLHRHLSQGILPILEPQQVTQKHGFLSLLEPPASELWPTTGRFPVKQKNHSKMQRLVCTEPAAAMLEFCSTRLVLSAFRRVVS
ncbi:hypothetical protein J1605_013712 [Eschrichtius robustus]|uniref:Uncharacterized protein n=1 Tax=Eschrichtius robustus TaxID=9764 RepID=A0AB34GEH8_ESCRO|nr:hypothetical protein J1605_013712 [Eschrichtius robustus]